MLNTRTAGAYKQVLVEQIIVDDVDMDEMTDNRLPSNHSFACPLIYLAACLFTTAAGDEQTTEAADFASET